MVSIRSWKAGETSHRSEGDAGEADWAYSGMMIVNAAPTKRPIPNTLIIFNLLPIEIIDKMVISICSSYYNHRSRTEGSPEIALNASGRYPTPNDAANVARA